MALTTEVSLVEQALSFIGISKAFPGDADGTLANCTDTSIEKIEAEKIYASDRDELLEEHPWSFAHKAATLVLVEELSGEPWGEAWARAFTYPTDCIRLRKFVDDGETPGYGWPWGGYSEWYWPWRSREWAFVVRVHDGAKVILTDVSTDAAIMSYTEAVSDVTRMSPWFRTALIWKVAHHIALPLAVSAEVSERAMNMYMREAWKAKAHDTNQDNPYPDPHGDFISARRGR